MNPQEERLFSRSSRGKILKSLKRKDPQNHQDPQEERFSKGKFLKRLKRKDPQIIKRKDSQEDSQEEFEFIKALIPFYKQRSRARAQEKARFTPKWQIIRRSSLP